MASAAFTPPGGGTFAKMDTPPPSLTDTFCTPLSHLLYQGRGVSPAPVRFRSHSTCSAASSTRKPRLPGLRKPSDHGKVKQRESPPTEGQCAMLVQKTTISTCTTSTNGATRYRKQALYYGYDSNKVGEQRYELVGKADGLAGWRERDGMEERYPFGPTVTLISAPGAPWSNSATSLPSRENPAFDSSCLIEHSSKLNFRSMQYIHALAKTHT